MPVSGDKLYDLHESVYVGRDHNHKPEDIGRLVVAFLGRFGAFWTLIPRMHADQGSRERCDLLLLRSVSCFQEHPDHLEDLVEQEHDKLRAFIRGFLDATERKTDR